MELETVNKLYLELSQVATAKTKRELELEDLQTKVDAITSPWQPMRTALTSTRRDRLCAAAPDLLEALIELADCGAEAWGEDRPCVKWARAAIAKATGEQP